MNFLNYFHLIKKMCCIYRLRIVFKNADENNKIFGLFFNIINSYIVNTSIFTKIYFKTKKKFQSEIHLNGLNVCTFTKSNTSCRIWLSPELMSKKISSSV